MWLGPRDVKKEHYEARAGDFQQDEAIFKLGFEPRAAGRKENASRPARLH